MFEKITSRLLLGFLLLSPLPLAGLSWYYTQAFERTLNEVALNSISSIADKKAEQINSYVIERLIDAQILANTPMTLDAQQFFSARLRGAGLHSSGNDAVELRYRSYFDSQFANTGYYDLLLSDAAGNVVFSIQDESDRGSNHNTGPFRDGALAQAHREVMASGKTIITAAAPYAPSGGKPAIFIVAPTLKAGMATGSVALQIDLERLSSVAADSIGMGQTGETVLAQREGDEALYVGSLRHVPDAAFHLRVPIAKETAQMRAALGGDNGAGMARDYAGNAVIGAWRYLPSLRWGMVVKQDVDEAYAPLYRLRKFSLVLLGLLLLSASLVAWRLGKSLIVPIRDLIATTRDISSGNMTQRALERGADEFRQLAVALNTMAGHLQASRAELELQIEQRTTDFRVAEQSAREGAQRTQAILDNVLDGIITINEIGEIETFSKAAEKIFGYRDGEVIGHNVKMLMPEPYHSQHDGYLHNFVSTGHKKIIGIGREVVGRRKDGSTFPMDLAVSEMMMGERRMFTGIVRDITERNQAIQARRDDAARMTAILNNVIDGIITINERGEIEMFSKAAEKIFGYREDEVAGRNVKMLMPEPYHSEHDGYLHNYAATGKRKIIGTGRQVVGRRKDGSTFPMDLAVTEMQVGERRMFTGIVRDITERVKVERMKSEFISTVSHELRTPLTSIRGSLALIVGGVAGELPPKARPLVDIAHKNSERLILLVNDILDMEKIEAGKMEFDLQPVELMPLLTQALEGNRAYAEQYKVNYELESELPGVRLRVDANRLMQVFANLLSNAAKFSPAGEKVMIAVKREDRRIRVAVKNRGPGIPDEFKSRIFQKFAQADSSDTRKKGGTGLGLSITKAIVEQMGGDIGFDSQPDVLTEFYFEFPEWLEPSLGPARTETGRSGAIVCVGFKVLHVEDDADVFHVVSGVLQDVAETTQATSLNEAKEMLVQGSYDLVILDLDLAGQSGKELLPLLKQAVPRIPVMVFSALDVAAEEVRGADAVLLKSRDDNAQILATVKRLIGIV